MELKKYYGIDKLASLEVDRILNNYSGRVEDETVLGLIRQAVEASRAGILPLPLFEKDQFISTTELRKLADRSTMNNKVLLAECEVLMATAQVIESILSGVESETSKSCLYASESVKTLIAYHEAMSSSGRSVMVVPEHLTGSFNMIGGAITSAFSGGSDAGIAVESIETNGRRGNFVEVASNTPVNKSLKLEDIALIDVDDKRKLIGPMTDGDETSMTEIEAYDISIPDVQILSVSETLMPPRLTKVRRPVRNGTDPVYMEDVDWGHPPLDGSLYADITLSNNTGSLSMIKIRIASRVDVNGSSIPIPSVERVDVSSDKNSWTKVDCSVDSILDSAGGVIGIHVNSLSSKYVRIRIRQSVSYSTLVLNAAHWFIPSDGNDEYWLSGESEPTYTIDTSDKRLWFRPSIFADSNGNKIKRSLFAIPANRFSISMREVSGEIHQYSPKTTIESKSYQFTSKIDRVIIRSTEIIPENTSIKYEISPDNGGTYYPIVPMERSGQGAEVLVFSSGGASNPNIRSASYVQVADRPKQLKIRLTLNANNGTAPSIQRMSLEPIFVEE